MEDTLVFSAAWKSRPMVAQEVLEQMKAFLLGLARISPWDVPFDVSGTTARQAYMPIAEDFSDFDEIVLRAMDNKEVRYFSDSDPDTMRIRPDSRSVFGMHAKFSDYPQKHAKKNIVTIDIGMGSSDGSCNSGVSINVPQYTPYTELNGIWAMAETFEQPQAIFEYLIEFFDPYLCSIYSSAFLLEITEWGIDINSPIGWLSYTRNPKVIAALKDDPNVDAFRDGILIKVGDSPLIFKDPRSQNNVRTAAIKIRDKLRAADATDWMEGV